VQPEVAAGRRILLAAFDDLLLVGTVQVILAMPPNQPHRAEIEKSHTWRSLANQKLEEVLTQIRRLQHAERLLERATACQCISLTDCADLLLKEKERIPSLERHKQGV